MRREISGNGLTQIFKEKLAELVDEPEFQRSLEQVKYATDTNGEPSVKLAVANVPLGYDLWQGLRNPAGLGLYPAGLPEIWEFYANRRRQKVDESGRQTVFQIPRSFDFARNNYGRAVIVSVMLPFSQRIIEDYTQLILEKRTGSSHVFFRMYEEMNRLMDKAVTRAAIDLVADDNAVLAMNVETVKGVSTEAMPQTRQGVSHGPSKGGNFPQKSLAVLTGLGQFGISRIVFRDELISGKVQRFVGPLRSIIIFDKEESVRDGRGDIVYPTEAWRDFVLRLFDFTDVDPEVNKYRFCSYLPLDDEGCAKCVSYCPSGAQANSVPGNNGLYPEKTARQAHRFWKGALQFDYARCCDDRGQMTTLFPEWSCARCVSICAAAGNRKPFAVENFHEKMLQLTKTLTPTLIPK